MLASALLAQAKTTEAWNELGKLRALEEKTENRESSLRLRLEQGRILLTLQVAQKPLDLVGAYRV